MENTNGGIGNTGYIRSTELRKKLGGISYTTLWRLIQNGQIQKPQKLNGQNIWPADVEPRFDDEHNGRAA